jgi:dipeptide/tripeptide permease
MAGFATQLRQFGRTFWISNLIEMCERLAYYGLRTVLPTYMLLAMSKGGPEFDNVQKGEIYAIWAAIQSFVPIFSGGYADRLGYRVTIAASVFFDVAGFLTMAWSQEIAAALSQGASVGVPGHPAIYSAFLAGACLLAFGTAVFKPGIQGLIATQITKENGSFAWSIFYQVVNIGGFVGPFLAGALRVLTWRYVFVACAAIATLNLAWLLLVAEPERERPKASATEFGLVALRGLGGILEPRLFAFLAVFSGFWAMFYQLYDLLPNYIEDWVDSRAIHDAVARPLFGLFGSTPPEAWNGNVPQEMMINLNAGMIMLLVSTVGFFAGRMSSMRNMVLGILVSAVGILGLQARDGMAILGAIAVFSIGEMFASPTKMRYVADLATPDKKALYLGYVNATVGIGWTIGSWIAGPMYEQYGDKVALGRRYLVEEVGLPHTEVSAIAKADVLSAVGDRLSLDAAGVTETLWAFGDPALVWRTFAGIGLLSMGGMLVLDRLLRLGHRHETWMLAAWVGVVTGACYGPGYGLLFGGLLAAREGVVRVGRLSEDRAWIGGAVVIGVAALAVLFA